MGIEIIDRHLNWCLSFSVKGKDFLNSFRIKENPAVFTAGLGARFRIYRCRTRSLISWVRPWFQY